MTVNAHISFWIRATLHSYTQVFFSKNKVFAVLLVLVTFFDPYAGLAGIIAVVFTNLVAFLMKYDTRTIEDGSYGFNSLLVGLGMGVFFEGNVAFYVLLLVASLLTFFFTIGLAGVLYKYRLSYLSIPFLLGIWIILLATRQFGALGITERGVYYLNELYGKGGAWLIRLYEYVEGLSLPSALSIYFKSLCAILFQYNIVAGILVAIGLLIYSRIGFTLSLISFFAAYWFYHFIGADITDLSYSYIGFNYILSGIAIGGFFIVPSKWSYFWTVVIIPILVVITAGLGTLLGHFQLGLYSLPFNIVVLIFLYVLKFRKGNVPPVEVGVQRYSPEKHVYDYQTHAERFAHYRLISLGLPVFGKWLITQGHSGKHTHREGWRHAWDFEIAEKGKTYKNEGKERDDYYCFDKPVLAPANGTIVTVVDGVPDNEIGEFNLKQNWGNSIVIKHGEGLFTQLSHLRANSIKVQPGDIVKQGQALAGVGNSGRSPVPHLHFQVQEKGEVGASTLKYPLSGYTVVRANECRFITFGYPQEGEYVESPEASELMEESFRFIPDLDISIQSDRGSAHWRVGVNVFNESYLEDSATGSRAYFKADRSMFYFTHYEGRKGTLLHWFFLAAYHVPLGSLSGVEVRERIPIYQLPGLWWRWFYDFIAPFFPWVRADYVMKSTVLEEGIQAEKIEMRSEIRLRNGWNYKIASFQIQVAEGRIQGFTVKVGGNKISITCEY